MSLSDIGVLAAEELATIGRETPDDGSPVKRISLGHNRLTNLPTEFALLSHLRYLNLKHNCFTVFPEVLTSMPSLDTLDISHNKIKRLPSQAGHLVHLRVFCLSRNKITRLPSYFSQFRNLQVLQVDRNPIEWPPKSVLEQMGSQESDHVMQHWIQNLQQWIGLDTNTRSLDDSVYSEKHELDNYIEESYNSWRFPLHQDEFDAGVTPHTRSYSVDSNFSVSSITESFHNIDAPSQLPSQSDRPPPLHLGILGTFSSENSPTRSLDSYLPSPADSEFFDNSHSDYYPIDMLESQHHVRNASYGGGLHPNPHTDLPAKKSLPDLRTAKLDFRKKTPELPDTGIPMLPAIVDRPQVEFSVSSPIPQRQDSDSSLGSSEPSVKPPIFRERGQLFPTRTVPSMSSERNSYFWRLSTLPISTSLPKPLTCLIDSARSILFAMCQVYQTLEHYMLHAIDDRISSVLKKVLDPAGTDMMQLIHSLERFDTTSRKILPPPAVCRAVVESCRDTVAVFGKAVGVLSLQLKVIITGDDVRYSRWILLELFGATAEISCAWRAMVPQIDAIRVLLRAKQFATQSPLILGTAASETCSSSPPSTVPAQSDPPVSLRPQPNLSGTPGSSVIVGRTRTARRHAGSFSSKDVEIGKDLPSYDDDLPIKVGGIASGVATRTPTLRAPKRQATVPLTTISSPSPTAAIHFGATSMSTSMTSIHLGESSHLGHSRHGSQASLQTSASSSPSFSSKATFLELPSTSKTQVDKEALQAVQSAIEVAPTVWDMIEDMLGDALDLQTSVRESIDKARAVTTRLSDTIQAIYDGDISADRRVLREDAHIFLKVVVQLSNIIKTYRGPHPVSSALRTGMVKLTNSTEEFAILLHVSSFSPSTPRSYTPVLGASMHPALSAPEESRLGSSLSRSRSAQPSASFKLPPHPQHDSPRSALPTQSFKIQSVNRPRNTRNRDDIAGSG
ncbi:Leucine-rich repeat-containing protein sog2 [Hypsizygus marmoreus]|uniref:Leucine-rich repeat-containing protein sog2 n=1 Tax=Hypsizygus marmoreus TaxID=39966 RepID=A0A369JR36_HYPMA|nr:Leucine-rich repeat-containing protein sog2 [Hypsizygus marmoreus]